MSPEPDFEPGDGTTGGRTRSRAKEGIEKTNGRRTYLSAMDIRHVRLSAVSLSLIPAIRDYKHVW